MKGRVRDFTYKEWRTIELFLVGISTAGYLLLLLLNVVVDVMQS